VGGGDRSGLEFQTPGISEVTEIIRIGAQGKTFKHEAQVGTLGLEMRTPQGESGGRIIEKVAH